MRGLFIDFSALTPDGTNTIDGIRINDPATSNGSVTSAISILGTNWTQAIYTQDAIKLADNARLNIGDANDLFFYHDGTNSYIQNDTGNLQINGLASNEVVFNEGGFDVDLRVEGSSGTSVLHVNAGN